MFYLKHKGKRLEIHDDNVYTRCPQCGKERVVDLQEILSSGDGDLYGTAIFCSSCLEKHKKRSNYKNSDFTHQKLSRLLDGTIPVLMK